MALGLLVYCTTTRVTVGAPCAAPPPHHPPLASSCVRPTRRVFQRNAGTRVLRLSSSRRGSSPGAFFSPARGWRERWRATRGGWSGRVRRGAGVHGGAPPLFPQHLPTPGARCNGVPDRPSPRPAVALSGWSTPMRPSFAPRVQSGAYPPRRKLRGRGRAARSRQRGRSTPLLLEHLYTTDRAP